MSQNSDEQSLIRGYLLGELDEAGQERLELLLLTDAAYADLVAVTQDELVDEYALGSLTAREREQFEKHYLAAPEPQQKLRIARALNKYLVEHPDPALARTEPARARTEEAARPNASWKAELHAFLNAHRLKLVSALALAALVLVGYGSWVFINNRRLLAQLAQLREQQIVVERELAWLNEPLRADTYMVQPGRQLPEDNAVLNLKPYLLRDNGDLRRAMIENERAILQLRLELAEQEYPNYRALIKTEDGKEFTVEGLRSRMVGDEKVVVLRLPAKILPTGDLQVRLVGLTPTTQPADVGLYPFQVINKTLP
jgi:hypothetical protein